MGQETMHVYFELVPHLFVRLDYAYLEAKHLKSFKKFQILIYKGYHRSFIY